MNRQEGGSHRHQLYILLRQRKRERERERKERNIILFQRVVLRFPRLGHHIQSGIFRSYDRPFDINKINGGNTDDDDNNSNN